MVDRSYIYLIHILFVAPLLIYSGYLGDKLSSEGPDNVSKHVFRLLISVGVVVILYHSFLLIKLKNIF